MPNPEALFYFRLSGGHAIGRVELLRLWTAACGSNKVAVSRVESGGRREQPAHTYSLLGPAAVPDIYAVEDRMRAALMTALPKATFVLSRY